MTVIQGLVAPYGVLSEPRERDGRRYRIRFRPGAFGPMVRAINAGQHPCVAGVRHRGDLVLARAPQGLRLEERADGLWARIVVETTYAAQRALDLVRSERMGGASIQFEPDRDVWIRTGDSLILEIHTLSAVDEITVTDRPAFPQTSVWLSGGSATLHAPPDRTIQSRRERFAALRV
jgi:HK97 family phage prohead protease